MILEECLAYVYIFTWLITEHMEAYDIYNTSELIKITIAIKYMCIYFSSENKQYYQHFLLLK